MPPKVEYRNLSPLMQKIRDFFLGRKYNQALRFGPELATRSPPLPVLPPGIHEKLSENYYYDRDARRLVRSPDIVFFHQNVIGQAKNEPAKAVTPGKVYLWDK